MLHVVAAVIRNEKNQIMIAQRAAKQHQGGKWEFPGGKVETGETPQQALTRELEEELGIQIASPSPLIQVCHHYPDLSVLLEVYDVRQWQGEAYGKEGQPTRWVNLDEISSYDFPVANKPILQALKLPDTCLITPDVESELIFQQGIQQATQAGIKLIQFRAKNLSTEDYISRAHWLSQHCDQYDIALVFNSPPQNLVLTHGLHLTSTALLKIIARPNVPLLSAACHNETELLKAQEIGADFVFLSPIQATPSHPDQEGNGWEWFEQSIAEINLPVYALGGLSKKDIALAKRHDAQGIAAISQLWQVNV